MTTIGTAVLQIIPSLDGVSAAVDKQLGGTLKAAGKKGGKSFGQSLADGIKAGEADVKRALEGYSKLYDKQADSAGKLKVAKAALADLDAKGIQSGARYTRSVEAAEKAQRDHNRALRDAKDAFGDYEKAAKDAANAGDKLGDSNGGIFSKLKGLAGSAKDAGGEAAGGFLDGFGGSIGELGTKGGPIGTALAAAAVVALAAGAVIGTNLLAGIEKEAQADKVQAKFGLDESQMATFGKAAGESYGGNFGESVTDNINAAAVALQNGLLPAGADDQTTSAAINQLTTVATILGVDIPEAARSAGQLVKTGFAKDFNDAADLIVSGSQSGLNISEDWLDTVNEYSTQFRKLGISGPEALGLLSQAVKGGARDTDVAADALKEFSIRSVDGSKTTVDAFTKIGLNADDMAKKFAAGGQGAHDGLGQVLDGLRKIQDPAERSRVAVELFGTQAEDLGGALNNFDLSTAVNQLGQVQGAAQRASDTMGNNAAGSVASAKRNLELGLNTFQESLAQSLGPYLEDLAKWVTEHSDDITAFFTTAGDAARVFTGAVISTAGVVIETLGTIGAAAGDMAGFVLDGFESLTGGAAAVADAFGAHGVADQLRDAQEKLGGFSDAAHGFAEGFKADGASMVTTGSNIASGIEGSQDAAAQSAKNAKDQVAGVAAAMAAIPGAKNIDISAIVTFKDTSGLVISPDQLKTPTFTPAVPGETRRPTGGGRAEGGSITGPGGPTSDIIPIWASNGEHMFDATDVKLMGGQQAVYGFRAALKSGAMRGFAGGGAVDVDAAKRLVGTPYSQGSRFDCSGTVARVINAALGIQDGGLMTTKTAAEWLAARGFKPGTGGPGSISVGWYDHGPNPNDGHMAMTLSDGTNAEAGGKNSKFTLGAGASGANSPQFDHHMFLAIAKAVEPLAAAAGAAPGVVGEGPATSGSGGAGPLPSSISGLASFGLSSLGAGVGTTKQGSDLSVFGGAAAAAVSGQVDSALGVLGVGGSPGILKAATMLVGGLKVGGHDPSGVSDGSIFNGANPLGSFGQGSAAPISATSTAGGTPPPDDVHGSRAGQPAGPQTVFNISTARVEDAFLAAQRKQNEAALMQTSRF